MKKILIIGILSFFGLHCFSQSEPTQNYEQVLVNENLKRIKTMYYRSEDTTKSEGRLLFKKEFDEEGVLARKYVYTFWDVVSYDHTTKYKYDSKGNLIEKTKIQKILNLGKRDAGYIEALGDDPINEKSFYTYDESNRLLKEVNYTFGKEGFDKKDTPSNTVEYTYNQKGQLIKEIGKAPNGRIIYRNYEATYDYDKNGNKIKETRIFTTSPTEYSRTTTYSYNNKGKLIEEKTEDSGLPSNNKHLKYEYDSNGRIITILRFSQNDDSWEVTKAFSFDENGNPILGDDETTFTFYENGLIKGELWKSSRSDETVNFITTYEFY
ncbi:hypothetical protein JKA74_08750 [Marivirga sp. S37H4]|uniref:Uncharacterized protein n=1 Tax=Marivirga aurantiaca TaxID=2802615 RepID=A0A934WXT3_9BACT|nr:hypothetical protein [Marivirga aurantiaca]MBK6265124.1 hypothetical protein [Marivirga aurantiaca]